jgi:hypothetical protein
MSHILSVQNKRAIIILAFTRLIILWPSVVAAERLTWIEDSFEDFNDGEFDSSGADLYATAKGAIKTINRFDLNGDGYLDLVFNASHDVVAAIPPTCYELSGQGRSGQSYELPALGTKCAAVADLNKDGFLEAVLLPNHDGSTPRRYMSIFWGGDDGWSGRRKTGLITISPLAVDVADIDGDTWLDIIVLNGSRWAPEDGRESVLRIYWGSEEGFRYEAFKDLVLDRAVDLKVEDLDNDLRPDIVILRKNPSKALIFWNDGIKREGDMGVPSTIDLGTPSIGKLAVADFNGDGKKDLIASGGIREVLGRDPTTGAELIRYSGVLYVPASANPREWEALQKVNAPPSSTLCAADLYKDGLADIVLADKSVEGDSVTILWADVEGRFQIRQPTILTIGYCSALAVDDLDGDGNLDLAVAVDRCEDTYQAFSRIYYGDGKGAFEQGKEEIPTAEVRDVVIAPRNKDIGPRIIFCNNRASRIREDVPAQIYWGGSDGFNPERSSFYHMRSGYASSATDLNDDGYVDVIMLSIIHGVTEDHPEIGINILWGDKDGIKDDRRTILKEYGVWSVGVNDVDRDGYLDIISACKYASLDGDPRRVVIWHGGPDGYQRSRRVMFPLDGVEGQHVTADFNKDGYLDIAVAREDDHRISIFWGDKAGFTVERHSSIPLVAANDLKTADLDADGWLDLVVTSHKLPNSLYWDFGTYIYWGSAKGFSAMNAQHLPADDAIGLTIADFDGNGHLDIYTPNYHLSETRESVPSRLFWGSADGFSDTNRTDLMQDGGHGSMAGDFNRDGLLDLAVACHTRDGNHYTESLVFYNNGKRFTQSLPQRLPTVGPHFMQRADVGNTYDRTWRQTYISSVYSWEQTMTRGQITYAAETLGKSRLEISVRTAQTEDGLADASWRVLGKSKSEKFTIDPNDRYLQYRAAFISDNGDRYPVLDRVEVALQN